ncbi:MAG: serine hydrolase [Chloroflexi bacterium]|nr:serine hydrolase [Chloroflexota bacterium]
MSDRLGRSTPEAQGVASGAIQKFIEAVEASGEELHSLMLLRHGQVIAEGWWSPYRADRPHMLFSLSKSFTSTAIGLAAAEGRLTVDDLVAGYFPDDLPEVVSPNLAALKIRHLLSMSVGHVTDSTESMTAFPKGRWKQGFLAHPVEREPGTHFVYNSGATYMLSAILQKVTGMRLLDYLRPRLLDPIGIGRATWEQSPEKIDTGGWGLRLVTEDIARFGQLYLQNGVWQGKQIVPEAWVREATSWKIDNGPDPNSDWNQGYAYQFWRCRHKSYRGDGAFGQYCVVMPEQDAVLVMTGAMRDMQIPLNCAWDHLLPAMSEKPRRANKTAQTRLNETLTTRALLPPAGAPDSPMADQIDGKTYKLKGNWVGSHLSVSD